MWNGEISRLWHFEKTKWRFPFSNAMKKLMELDVLVPVDNSKRERSFAYEEYLAILRKDT